MNCPSCSRKLVFDGQKHACGHCGGSLVDTTTLRAMVSLDLESNSVPLRLNVVRCPSCMVWMRAFTLDGIALDRCAEHGIWFDGNELERLVQKHDRRATQSPATLDSAYHDELSRRLGVPVTVRGREVTFVEHGATFEIEYRLARVSVQLVELAGFELVVRLGNAGVQADAELGDPRFDRDWTVLTPAPELARIVLSPAVRAELDVARTLYLDTNTAPSIVIRNGRVTVELPGYDRAAGTVVRCIGIARLLARRMRELHEELDAVVTAFGGRRESPPWSWAHGFSAILPHHELSAVLRIGVDRRGRLATLLVLDGAPELPWGLVAKRTSYDGEAPWRPAAVKGYIVGGAEPELRAVQVALANPDWIETTATRCELGWVGWMTRLDVLRAALELGAAVVGTGPTVGPYR